MSKDLFVTGDLHRIGDKIAMATKSQCAVNASQDDATSVTASDPALQSSMEAKTDSSYQKTQIIHPELNQALLRRQDEFLRSRKDVAARMATQITELETESEQLTERTKQVENALELLRKMDAKLHSGDEHAKSISHLNQSVLAAEARELENMRLEAIRLHTRMGIGNHPVTAVPSSLEPSHLELDSLSFHQIFRVGLILSSPILLTLFLVGLMIAFAVVAAFNGTFRW